MKRQIEAEQEKDLVKTESKRYRLVHMISKHYFTIIFSNLDSLKICRHEEICLMPISIEELTSCKAGNVFHGNIIVTYRTILDKLRKTIEIL